MKLRTKETVRPSGIVRYHIQEKKWYGWKTIKTFAKSYERDNALRFIYNSI